MTARDPAPPHAVAVVGMAVRSGGAADLAGFDRLVRSGGTAIRRLERSELIAAGVPAAVADDPDYLPFAAPMPTAPADDLVTLDLAALGIAPEERDLVDPQHVLFLDGVRAALDDAGYGAERARPRTGVFACARYGTHGGLALDPGGRDLAAVVRRLVATEKDYLATRVSFAFDLRGPSMTVQSACSSSLVAVHLAVQHLLAGECDMAVAGGVAVLDPQCVGWFAQDGINLSHDGACRPFDAEASGTVGGHGLGVVVLRRLADARAAGDRVHAVLRGSAVNNDGAGRPGYTAASAAGQAEVMREAMGIAEVAPEHIGFVETHGTAAPLGDLIEMTALRAAFGDTGRCAPGGCALGAVKANIGHLGAAGGVVGLIRTVLALKAAEIPPLAGFRRPHPQLGLDGSPFRAPVAAEPWRANGGPRCAGVHSTGYGGTNAHVILQEWSHD
ncbi:polyketide synthase [Rhodoplanes sp. TEM]|uniref:Polyketide synthase n=1 Tax=Rhodoplanes tepidamans TaxID=200616 RepID=A0ABT5JEY3_RHOTP|nr:MULTISPECIES: polyketide synthase [Rhodoplanes]MDC7788192.1 polyketide synthase [Rhodoplanes tepidamans]MDC7987891.1 polyketide synthase [Rhodoplanes sp. TEM]MDQ0354224.1 acyl transferase domain-containing protein [Rhodoplanes tepidamans]